MIIWSPYLPLAYCCGREWSLHIQPFIKFLIWNFLWSLYAVLWPFSWQKGACITVEVRSGESYACLRTCMCYEIPEDEWYRLQGDCIKCSQVMAAVLLRQFFSCLFQILTNGPSYFKGSSLNTLCMHTNYRGSLIDFLIKSIDCSMLCNLNSYVKLILDFSLLFEMSSVLLL